MEAKFLTIGTKSSRSHENQTDIWNYRFDSSGNILEHYCDGYVVNDQTPVEREPQSTRTIYSWGPEVPLAFMTGKVEDVGKLFSTFISAPKSPENTI